MLTLFIGLKKRTLRRSQTVWTKRSVVTAFETHMRNTVVLSRCAQIFCSDLGSPSRFWAPERWHKRRFQTHNPQISGDTAQNFDPRAALRPEFVYPCFNGLVKIKHQCKTVCNFTLCHEGMGMNRRSLTIIPTASLPFSI